MPSSYAKYWAAKRGIFEGDIDNGELEIGQSSAYVKEVLPTAVIMQQIVQQYDEAKKRLARM